MHLKNLSNDFTYLMSGGKKWENVIENTTIEICPMYNIDERYRIKMDKKQKLFKCILLKSIEEIDLFIENRQNI